MTTRMAGRGHIGYVPSMKDFDGRLRWTRDNMPVTAEAVARLPDLSNVRLACSMHLEIKMVPAIDGLVARGAQVFLTTCNGQTVDDETIRWSRERGLPVYAWRGMSEDDRARGSVLAAEFRPTHLCEMGADLTGYFAREGGSGASVVAALEGTGSGTARLASLPLRYPVFNWDDLPIKEGLHNRHLVGLVACHAFFEKTRLTFHGRRVLVVGYGLVGRSACHAARAYGGRILVAERNPARALEARFAGEEVVDLEEGIAAADVVITATGARHVIGREQYGRLRRGAFLLNVGHANEEYDLGALTEYTREEVAPSLERVSRGEHFFHLFAGGAMANLVAGHGDSLNAFDVTLATMLAGIGFMVREGAKFSPGVHVLPEEAWIDVARLAMR
jgi:adenosylhomocysteinase